MRIGHGYDVHKLVKGRELILGGIKIDHPYGLLGHSDADVLTHVVMDALLGAAALGDIGRHFPDTDETYKDASSIELLKKVASMLDEKTYIIENIDATIIAQKPKLLPYIDAMRERLAYTLNISISQINIKATTEEWMGFTGRKEGMAAHCVCLLTSISDIYTQDIANIGGGCGGCGGCGNR